MPGSKVATWHNKINKLSQSTSYCCLSKTRWNLSPHHLPQCRAESGIRYRHRPGTDQSITFFCCIHFPFEGYVLDKNCSRSFYVHHISIDLDIPPRDLQPRYSIKFWPIKWYLIYGISMRFSKSQRSRSVRSGEMRNVNPCPPLQRRLIFATLCGPLSTCFGAASAPSGKSASAVPTWAGNPELHKGSNLIYTWYSRMDTYIIYLIDSFVEIGPILQRDIPP